MPCPFESMGREIIYFDDVLPHARGVGSKGYNHVNKKIYEKFP
jgi:hypothetical protein